MFTKKTIQKVINNMTETYKKYENVDVKDIQLCISEGNSKIGKAMNVSLPPILTCANCKECKYLCYDIKACNQYSKNVVDARIRNLAVLHKNRDEYFNRIDQKMTRRRTNKFLRFHVAGDILDIDYFDRMVKLAAKHPDFKVWTYTKNYKTVNEWVDKHGMTSIPKNLTVMFSEWRGVPMQNPHGFPEFRVVFKDEKKPKGFYCPGNCDVCKSKNLGCIANKTVYCMEH